MKTYIFDIEVFAHDWFVVFYDISADDYVVFHNDNKKLKAFMTQPDAIFGGFNCKHYDDWIIMTMILGGSPEEVKRHNDWILEGHDGWTFPYIQYQKKPFHSFDLRDDIADKGLSLKAIEGNMGLPIVESSVPFDLDRPLTDKEKDEVVYYCKHDVQATYSLYKERGEYLDSKQTVGSMYGIPEWEALSLTNAKLSARVLNAKKATRSDERNYEIPACLDASLIPKVVLDFFMQIKDMTIPDTKLFGTGKQGSKGMTLDVIIKTGGGECPVTYAWGGVHGAKPAITIEIDEDHIIINFDVSSLYPNSMINFGYCSRSMEDPEAYKRLVQKRMEYKKAGDKDKASALKLVVNTTYGAMLNEYNDLADRRNGRSVCISNQLAMTQLIVMLGQACETIDFININTDGVMFLIEKSDEQKAVQTVDRWCKITGFEMERSDFKKIIQKDVNNYIAIKPDNSFKTKGGFVSLYKGGNFKTNSLSILDKAVVEYLVNGTEPEETIRNEKSILAFQNIIKTGSMYQGTYQYIGEELVELQNVNRIYAVKDQKYGPIIKRKVITEKRRKDKETGRMISTPIEPPKIQDTTVSDCPEHPMADNENMLTIQDLDLSYYIDMAKKRIQKYTELDPAVEKKINKITKVVTIMQKEDMNIFQKHAAVQTALMNTGIKKTGKNAYSCFYYHTLQDMLPPIMDQLNKYGLTFYSSFEGDEAVGYLVNCDNPVEKITVRCPMCELITNDKKYPNGMNSIQALGGAQTYIRRYLLYMMFNIIEPDELDATSGKPERVNTDVKQEEYEQPESLPETITEQPKKADKKQIESIKRGLKTLRQNQTNGDCEQYISEIIMQLQKPITYNDADNILIDVTNRVKMQGKKD